MRGGKRPGAGRPPGSKNKKTLEREAAQDAFNKRVMESIDKLFNAQHSLATGTYHFLKYVPPQNKEASGKWELVRGAKTIKQLLDKGEQGKDYIMVEGTAANNQSIDSLLNRALGKPPDNVRLEGKDGGPIETLLIVPKVEDEEE